jgi:hypothetical protein
LGVVGFKPFLKKGICLNKKIPESIPFPKISREASIEICK